MQIIIDGFNAVMEGLYWEFMFSFIILAWLFNGFIQRITTPSLTVLKQVVLFTKGLNVGWLVFIFGVVLGYGWICFGAEDEFKRIIPALAFGMMLHQLILKYVLSWLTTQLFKVVSKAKNS